MAELAYPVAPQQHASERATGTRDKHPVYWFWHGHISALLAAQRPDIDAGMIAHLMLGSLHSEAVLDQLTTDGPARVAAAMPAVACAVLDAPAPDTTPRHSESAPPSPASLRATPAIWDDLS